jgi:hypothetical protein
MALDGMNRNDGYISRRGAKEGRVRQDERDRWDEVSHTEAAEIDEVTKALIFLCERERGGGIAGRRAICL